MRGRDWVDPRAPDGTTILAPKEQYSPADFPGLTSGDVSTDAALFDLDADPAEQHNVASDHPQMVAELTRKFAQWEQEATRLLGERGIKPGKGKKGAK
jgi:N-acetylgalactosamine-6-sulfatase